MMMIPLDLQEKIKHSSQAHLDHVSQVQNEAVETLIKLSEFIKDQAGEISDHLDVDNLDGATGSVNQVAADMTFRPLDDEPESQLVGALSRSSPSNKLLSQESDQKQIIPSLQVVKPTIDESSVQLKDRKNYLEDSQLPFISDELFEPYDEYPKSDD